MLVEDKTIVSRNNSFKATCKKGCPEKLDNSQEYNYGGVLETFL